jgi:hypothetical protein
MENGVFFESIRQLVIGDLWAEMVNVMVADITGEPVQYGGQFIE